ncbi:MAG: hypothetical protein Q8S84_08305 [bacterium]|nr:hypothetical protein [bacterium]MDP3381437.1 hypothetical protein [bacterium]
MTILSKKEEELKTKNLSILNSLGFINQIDDVDKYENLYKIKLEFSKAR